MISPRTHLWLARGLGLGALIAALAMYARWQLSPALAPVLAGGSPKFAQVNYVVPGAAVTGALNGNDFKHIYLGTRALWRGQNPYDPRTLFDGLEELVQSGETRVPSLNPFVYPPFTGLALGPLTRVPYSTALLLWFLASHAMMWLAAAVSLWALGLLRSWRAWVFAALFLAWNHPLSRNMSAGQLNAPLALAYPLFFLALRGRRLWLAGGIAAAAAWFKLSPGILLIYLLWRRQWRAAAWMCGWGVALLALAVGWAGVDIHRDFLPLLRDMGYGHSTWSEYGAAFYSDPANQSFNSLFHHLVSPAPNPAGTSPLVPLSPAAANALTWFATLGLFACVFWLTRTRRAAPGAESAGGESGDPLDEAAALSLFIILSLLAPSLCWDHYCIQALFPLLTVFAALERKRDWLSGALLAVSLLALVWPFAYGAPQWRSGAGLWMMSIRLWGAMGLFFCAARIRGCFAVGK